MEYLALFFIVLLLARLMGVHDIVKSVMASKWSHTEGVLTKWDMGNDAESDMDFVVNRVSYKYEVRGEHYESNSIGYGFPLKSGYSKSAFERVVKNGPKVTVYFKEADPKLSVLIVGFQAYHAFNMLMFGLLVCMVLIGIQKI